MVPGGYVEWVLDDWRPVLLVLDDLQWCDEDTLLWLSFLLELAADAPLLVAVKQRFDPDNPFHINQNIDPAA